MHGRLYIDFCGEERTLALGERLTFGRSGDLAVDDNPYLHRIVGAFEERAGSWWLRHLGTRTALEVVDLNAPSATSLAPGGVIGLHFGQFAVRFSAGPTRYELLGELEEHEWDTDLLGPDGFDTMRTLEWATIELNDDQRLLLLALCEARLLNPALTDAPVPTNRAVAERLGWSLPKVNRKLDHLSEKLARAGVPGVHGDAGASATERRRVVVDHALRSQLIRPHELTLLGAAA